MKLNKLLERLEYDVVQGTDEAEVTTLVNDSRKVEDGSVFVCISGAVSDGHKFAADVAAKGAAAVVVEKDVEVPEDVTVIRVPDTRYALALMSAAYFGYPAEKLYRDKGKDNDNLYDPFHPGGSGTQSRADRDHRGDHRG